MPEQFLQPSPLPRRPISSPLLAAAYPTHPTVRLHNPTLLEIVPAAAATTPRRPNRAPALLHSVRKCPCTLRVPDAVARRSQDRRGVCQDFCKTVGRALRGDGEVDSHRCSAVELVHTVAMQCGSSSPIRQPDAAARRSRDVVPGLWHAPDGRPLASAALHAPSPPHRRRRPRRRRRDFGTVGGGFRPSEARARTGVGSRDRRRRRERRRGRRRRSGHGGGVRFGGARGGEGVAATARGSTAAVGEAGPGGGGEVTSAFGGSEDSTCPLRGAPTGSLARHENPLVADSLSARPAARFACARDRCTRQNGSTQFGGYIRREDRKGKTIDQDCYDSSISPRASLGLDL